MINENQSQDERMTSTTDLNRGQNNPYPVSESQQLGSQRIRIGQKGCPAAQQHQKPFCQLVPLCLWLTCRQPHIIYYLSQSVFEYFKYCEPRESGELLSTILLIVMVLICIGFEMHARYNTYQHFAHQRKDKIKDKEVKYQTWNLEKQAWENTEMGDLMEGQIIKVERYLETDPRINPTNLLPIAYASRSRSVLIKTTRIDKMEDYKKVVILRPFHNMVRLEDEHSPMVFNEELFNMRIDYRFISSLGQTFEAGLSVQVNSEHFPPQPPVVFTNENIIPGGVSITTEDFVIGVVLKQIGQNYEKNLVQALSHPNNIITAISKYLKLAIIFNIALLMVTYIVNLIVTTTTADLDYSYISYSACYALNFIPNFMNTVYISMYILIYVFRLVDYLYMKDHLTVNSFTRSVDQLAQIDTLIMDDFFFVQRPFNNDDFRYTFNASAPLTDNIDLMLRVMEGATVLREHMAGHIVPIAKFFRLNRVKSRRTDKKVRIIRETVISERCIQVNIKTVSKGKEELFSVRFNDHPVYSTITKLAEGEFKQQILKFQRDYQATKPLMFFIQIQREQTDSSNQLYMLYGVITFHELFDRKAVNMLKDERIVNRYNVVMLTTKTRWYIEYFLEKSGMKSVLSDGVIMLDEKEQGQINQVIKDYRNTLRKKCRESHQYTKHNILFLSSTMITYLSRRNIRKSLSKLAKYCKYIVFYNCSQFEKQICAVNLFKIFQNHLFISNYLCDHNIFQWANLSICEHGATSEQLTTFAIKKYDKLPDLILKHAFLSLQVVQSIASNHIFKNQFLLGANLAAFFLVFQGGSTNLLAPYLSELFYFYNFVFTIFPLLYQFVVRNEHFIERDVGKYIDSWEMIRLSAKAFIFGVVTSFLAFSMIADDFVSNIFGLIFINAVICSNLFVLLIDNSKEKHGLVTCVLLQIVGALFLIIIIQLVDTKTFSFIPIGINFDPSLRWCFLATFLITPLFVTLVLYVFSVGREIWLIQNNIEMRLMEYHEDQFPASFELTSQNNTEMVVKVFRGNGKEIRLEQEVQISML